MSISGTIDVPAWGRSPAPTLVEILRWRAENEPSRRAIVYLPDSGADEVEHTYASLDARAMSIAAAIEARAAPGERVLLLYPPGLDFVEAFFGCLYAGVVAVPAYPPRNRGHLPRLRAIAADCGARFALTHSRTAESIRQQAEPGGKWAALELLATDLIPDAPVGLKPATPNPDALAFLQYTSGSTGLPKGVMVTHANLAYGAHYITVASDVGRDGVSVCWLPSFHDMGLVDGVMMPIYAGCLAVLLSPVGFIQRPASWLEAVSRFRGTHGGSPNFGYDLCARKVPPEARRELDLSSWVTAYNGSEPLRASTLRSFAESFASCGLRPEAIYPTYGLAEATLMVTGCGNAHLPVFRRVVRSELERRRFVPADEGAPDKSVFELVSSGRTFAETRIAVVDPETRCRAVAPAVGEVWIAGPTVCRGYWQRPEESESTFRARIEGEPGTWLRTGDLGFIDSAGELFICGRAKDLIIIRGRNHYPQDLEDTCSRAHTALRIGGAAAFSVDSEEGERLVMVQEVERTALRTLDVASVGEAIASLVAEEHEVVPSAVVLLKPGTVPKTSSGKIRRGAARDLFASGSLEAVGQWRPAPAVAGPAPRRAQGPAARSEREVADWLAARIAARLGRRPSEIDPRASFASFGLDSAGHIELSGDLRAWLGRPVPATALYDFPDIVRLAAHLAGPSAEGTAPAGLVPGVRADAVAVLGMGLRLPGGVGDPEAFWRLLREGVDAITEVPAGRWDARAVHDPRPSTPGRTNSIHGGFIEAIDRFDAEFFGISPREAVALDPQQRLLLETAWHALEDAALDPTALAGSDTGVFVGISTNDYSRRTIPPGDLGRIDAYSATGSAMSAAAGRLSYFFDFSGPAVAVDTACSSSLVAVHQACRSLLEGECSLALAGGVNAVLGPELAVNFSQARMLASDGRCKAFDAAADGYVRSEGCGLVVLKRLSEALADGDPVLAVIRGSAVGQDGRSNGLTAPNGPAQERVIGEALRRAGAPPESIGYVEAHGTGTALGDPIEVRALAAALGGGRPAGAPLLIGSVKTNLGHLEAAAGVASLAKAVLALDRGAIPPSLHLRNPNPHVPWETLPVRVADALIPFPAGARGGPRRAGVSSFGFTGTNAHVVVEEAPTVQPSSWPAGPYALPISARTPEAARDLAQAWASWLGAHPDAPIADVCETALCGRASMAYRGAAHGSTPSELAVSVGRLSWTRVPAEPPAVAFLFTGQGSQYGGMGCELLRSEPVFRSALERCAACVDSLLTRPLLEVIAEGGDALERTEFAQPAIFALEWSLAELLASWGVRPSAVAGHSVGEIAAACVAGVFSVEDGLRLVAARGRLMQELPPGGGMLAVLAGEEDAAACAGLGVSVAAVNAPAETVLSGPVEALGLAAKALSARGIISVPLAVSHAFHSPLMEPMLAEFDRVLASVAFSPPRFTVHSALGAGADVATAKHWSRHALGAVRFAGAASAMESAGLRVFLELGPKPILTALGRKSWRGPEARWIPTLRPGRGEWAQARAAAVELWLAGVPVEARALRAAGGRRLSGRGLPGYPFARERHWAGAPAPAPAPAQSRRNPTLRGWTAPASADAVSFGVMFFNGLSAPGEGEAYRFLMEATAFADAHGFSSVWIPERHYTRFGGLYPNPSVLGAALASRTRSLRVMAGSIVAPLHSPLRIAEDWAVIDNLSGGRAGVSFAPGWNPEDFAMNPGAYPKRHDIMFAALEQVRRLWRGEAVDATSGVGSPSRVRIHPSPVQPEFPAWITAAGNPASFVRAGEAGANVLTHLLDQEPAQLAEKIAAYRAARARCGLDPDAGRVTVMVHTFLGADDASVRARIRGPYCAYIKENIHLLGGLAASRGGRKETARMSPADIDEFVDFLFERFYASRALFGTPDAAARLVRRLGEAGVNEIGCLLDFGAPADAVLESLPLLDALRRRFSTDADEPAVEAPSMASPRAGEHPAPLGDILARVEWRDVPEDRTDGALKGPWLVLGGTGDFGSRVAAALADRGASPVLVGRGERFEVTGPGRFRVNPLCPADFDALLGSLPEPPAGAAHLWSLDVARPGPVTQDSVREGVSVGVASLLHLAQAFDRRAAPGKIWLVTRGARGEASEGSPACSLTQAPAWGLGRVLALEHSRIWGGAVDLDFEPSDTDAQRLVREMACVSAEDQVVMRGSRRLAPRLVPAPSEAYRPLALRPDATYLVTGGLGGLGRRVARWLADRGARHLVLTGLHPLPPRESWGGLSDAAEPLVRQKVEAVLSLERMGVCVQAVAADVCDASLMASILGEIARSGPPLAGVFHLAGLPENRPVRDTVFARDCAVLGPKTTGAWTLHELTRGLSLDWWVAFSSISAVWGSRGQPLYAAANTFLDALGQHRRALGLPATIVNWGPWSEGGMVVSAADQAMLARLGLGTTPPSEGISALEFILAAGRPHQVVATVDWPLFKDLFASRGRNCLFAEMGSGQDPVSLERTPLFHEIAALSAAGRVERLTLWLRDAVAATLRMPDGRLPDPTRGFFEMGMDSLMAIEIKNRLQAELGVPLRATVVFNYPNIASLAGYLGGLFPEAGGGAADPLAAGSVSDADMARLLEQEAMAALGRASTQGQPGRGES